MAGLLAKSKTDKSDDCSLESKKPDLNVLQEAKQTEFLYKSLQQSKVEQNRLKLFGIKETTPKANRAEHAKLDGLIAVLDSLTVPSEYERKYTTSGRWKGYLPFAIAFDLYSDLVFTGSHEYVTMKQQKYLIYCTLNMDYAYIYSNTMRRNLSFCKMIKWNCQVF